MRRFLAVVAGFVLGCAAVRANAVQPPKPVPSAPVTSTATMTPSAPPVLTPQKLPSQVPISTVIAIAPNERRYLQLGYQLVKGAFAYADIARLAATASTGGSKKQRIQKLAALAPLVVRDRKQARASFAAATSLLKELQAPAKTLALVANAANRLAKPMVFSPDAKALAAISVPAATTIGALDEYEILSVIPDNDGLRYWLVTSTSTRSAQVWYAEGAMIGLTEIASTDAMPDLLPPAIEIVNDLRGLRDWIASRLPDEPTAGQIALKTAMNDFLLKKRAGWEREPITQDELRVLGRICQMLRTELIYERSGP